jgi:hypothetical protein
MPEIDITFYLYSITCYITNILKPPAEVWNFSFYTISMGIISHYTF